MSMLYFSKEHPQRLKEEEKNKETDSHFQNQITVRSKYNMHVKYIIIVRSIKKKKNRMQLFCIFIRSSIIFSFISLLTTFEMQREWKIQFLYKYKDILRDIVLDNEAD